MLDSFRDPGSTPGASSFDGRPRDWGVRYANAPLSRRSVEASFCLAPHRAPAGVDRFAHRSLRCHPPPFRGSLTVWKHARFVAVEDGLGGGVILVHRGLPFSGSARSAGSAPSRRLPSASSPRCLAEPHHTAREGAVVSPLRLAWHPIWPVAGRFSRPIACFQYRVLLMLGECQSWSPISPPDRSPPPNRRLAGEAR